MSLTLIAGRSVKMSKYFCLRFKITFWYSLSSELRTEKWLITPHWRRVSQKTPRDKVHYMNIHGVVLSSWLFIKNSTDVFSTHPLTSSDISFKPGHVHIVCYHQSYWNFSNFQHQCCVWQGLTKKKVKKKKTSGIKAVWPVTVVACIPPTINIINWKLAFKRSYDTCMTMTHNDLIIGAISTGLLFTSHCEAFTL